MSDIFEGLTIRSASWNGYEREAALKELIRLADPRTIPIFVERSNDWVRSIMDLSKEALLELSKRHPAAIVSYLPQINRLSQKRRWDHAQLIQSLIKNLVDYAPDQLLLAAASVDKKISVIALKICVDHELATVEKLFEVMIANKQLHSSIQMMLLTEKLEDSYIDKKAGELLAIRYLPLKNKIIKRLDVINPSKIFSIAETLMYSRDAVIRSLGCKHLELSVTETIQYYLTCLNCPLSTLNQKVIAIAQLSALQKMEALPLLKNYLKASEPKMRRCVLNEISHLLGDQAKSIFTDALTDFSESVVREAARLCYKLGISFSQEEILTLAAITDRSKTIEQLLLISKLQERWTMLVLLLKLLTLYEHEATTTSRIQHAINRWWQAAYRGTGPIPFDRKIEIEALLLAGKSALLPYQYSQLIFMLDN